MSEKTMSDESTRTGMARNSRRRMYLYTGPRGRLLVDPEPRERGRAVPVVPSHGEGADVAQRRLPDQEPVVIGHPHPQHLVELALEDLLGDRALLGAVGRLAQPGDQIVDDGIGEAEVVLRGLGVHVLVGLLVEAHGVAGLEAPRHAVP